MFHIGDGFSLYILLIDRQKESAEAIHSKRFSERGTIKGHEAAQMPSELEHLF